MKNTPRSRYSNFVMQELERELLIYDLSTNKAYCLNETSALVYQLSDGKRTIQEISKLMSVKLRTPVNADFVSLALNELKRDGLIENADEMKEFFLGINRRELAKKVALFTILALPFVTNLTAPSAAYAASGNSPLNCPPGSTSLPNGCQVNGSPGATIRSANPTCSDYIWQHNRVCSRNFAWKCVSQNAVAVNCMILHADSCLSVNTSVCTDYYCICSD